jgi:hypothetical protein
MNVFQNQIRALSLMRKWIRRAAKTRRTAKQANNESGTVLESWAKKTGVMISSK